jgi:hypothetical protein
VQAMQSVRSRWVGGDADLVCVCVFGGGQPCVDICVVVAAGVGEMAQPWPRQAQAKTLPVLFRCSLLLMRQTFLSVAARLPAHPGWHPPLPLGLLSGC